MAIFGKSDKPILAVDIDGVISLFGFDQREGAPQMGGGSVRSHPFHDRRSDPFRAEPGGGDPAQAPGEFHLIDGMLHCISMPTGPRLNRLAESYELVWASGWEDRANDHLPAILGVSELPYLTFDGRAQFGTAHWKLDALDAHAGNRPLAWIDDSLDQSCFEWAERRQPPTLLVPTESDVGLVEAHVGALEAWVRDGFSPE